MKYIRHKRLKFYALRCKISNFSASYFQDYVSKVMIVSYKAHFAMFLVLLVVSYLSDFNVASFWRLRKINRPITSILKVLSTFSILSKVILYNPNQITFSDTKTHLIFCRWQIHNVTSRRVFAHRCWDTELTKNNRYCKNEFVESIGQNVLRTIPKVLAELYSIDRMTIYGVVRGKYFT